MFFISSSIAVAQQSNKCSPWTVVQGIDWSFSTISTSPQEINLGNALPSPITDFYASDTYSSGDVIQNKKINIHGNFIIDIPVSFKNCDFRIRPEVAIVVTTAIEGPDVGFYRCNFRSYGNMLWKGFKNVGHVHFTNNHFEDAHTAIWSLNTNFLATDNLFNKNLVGIYIDPQNNPYFNFPIYASHYNCTGNLLPPLGSNQGSYEFPDFPYTSRSYAGIITRMNTIGSELDDCEFISIGNHHNGILSYGSDLYAKDILFYNIGTQSSASNLDHFGYGIGMNLQNDYSQSGQLIQEGWTDSGITDYNFRNVKIGIYVKGGSAECSQNKVLKGEKGIYIESVVDASIFENRFDSVEDKSIFLENITMGWSNSNTLYNSIGVYDNDFSLSGSGVGIQMNGCYGRVSPFYSIPIHAIAIYDNQFRLGNPDVVGIGVENSKTAKLQRNSFQQMADYYNTYRSYGLGMDISGSDGIIVRSNVFDGSDDLDPSIGSRIDGLQWTGSQSWNTGVLSCNYTNETRNGFEFWGINELVIDENTFNGDDESWYINKWGTTAPQEFKDNKWLERDRNKTNHVYYEEYQYVPWQYAEQSRIKIEGSSQQYTVYDPYDRKPLHIREVELDGSYVIDNNCSTFPGNRNVHTGGDNYTLADELIAGEKIGEGVPFSENVLRKEQLGLYSKMQRDQDVASASATFTEFIEEARDLRMDKLYSLHADYVASFQMNEKDGKQLEDIRKQLKADFLDIEKINAQYRSGQMDHDAHVRAITEVSREMSVLEKKRASIMESYMDARDTRLRRVEEGLMDLSLENEYVENLRKGYLYSCRYHLENLRKEDIAHIQSFDGACVLQYQDVAFLMQYLSSRVGKKNTVDYQCEGRAEVRKNGSIAEGYEMIVTPNPIASGAITIEFATPMSGTISISNISGKLVYSGEVHEAISHRINTILFPAGLYIIRTTDAHYTPTKFVVQ